MIINKKINKKIIIPTTVIILVLIIIGGFYSYKYLNSNNTNDKLNNTNTIDYTKATEEQIQTGNQIKNNSINKNTSDKTPPPTPIQGSNQQSVKIIITKPISTNQKNGTTLQIRTQIDATTNNGTCTLNLIKDGQILVSRTVEVQPLADISTCKGFDIPASDLSTGTWQIKITYNSSSLLGSASKDLIID